MVEDFLFLLVIILGLSELALLGYAFYKLGQLKDELNKVLNNYKEK